MRRPQRRLSRESDRSRGRLAVPLGAAIAAMLATAGPAAAGSGYGQLIVNPGTAAPGQSISILGTCPNNGSGLRGVYSPAFAGGAASITQTPINFSGAATIAPGASGTYTVTADCGPGSPSVNITVAGAPVPSSQPPTPTQPAASSSPSDVQMSSPSMMPPSAMSGGGTGGGYTHAPADSAPPMNGGGGMGAGGKTSMGATASGMRSATPSMPGATSAGNGPVTSTGVVRVGLAGSSRSSMTTAAAAGIAVAAALAGGFGFLVVRRRRRNSSGSHI